MEAVPNTFPSLFWAYSAVWLVLAVYLFSLGARVRKLERSRDERGSLEQ